MFDLNLKDKVVLITGGSDGLGFASAKLLSEQGAKVVICGRRIDYLKEKANIIREATNNEILDIQCDVTNPDQCKNLVEQTIKKFNNIDVLVNNAGSSAAFSFEGVSDEDWEEDEYEESTGSFLSDMSVASKMKMAGGAAFVILILLSSTNVL